MNIQPDLVPVAEAARRLSISYSTYRRGAAAGQLPPIVKVRGTARVGVRALDAYITRLTSAAPDASHGSAAVVEASGTGRAGPTDGEQTSTGPSTPNQEVPT